MTGTLVRTPEKTERTVGNAKWMVSTENNTEGTGCPEVLISAR